MESTSETYQRTKTDVEKVIKLSKLDESDLNEITQVLQFSSTGDETSNIKLLELDGHLFKTLVEGECLSFRGRGEDSTVLCTKNRTYDIQEAETSNSLLLLPNLKFSKQTATETGNRVLEDTFVRGIFYKYFEVKRCKPRTEKVLELLTPSAFNGQEYESSIDHNSLYDWERLSREIQASEDELRESLEKYSIVNIDGYLRSITFEYETRALTLMLDLIEENSWAMDEVDKEMTATLLKDLIPEPLLQVLFAEYTDPSGKTKENGEPLYRLLFAVSRKMDFRKACYQVLSPLWYKEEKICKFLAKVLLAASPVNDYNDFVEAWQIGTPENMHPKIEWLRGIALIVYNRKKNIHEVVSYPTTDLPESITERFNELFKRKEKWTIEEISPYIVDIASEKISVNALLTKYSRSSTVNGIKYYSAKHGK